MDELLDGLYIEKGQLTPLAPAISSLPDSRHSCYALLFTPSLHLTDMVMFMVMLLSVVRAEWEQGPSVARNVSSKVIPRQKYVVNRWLRSIQPENGTMCY